MKCVAVGDMFLDETAFAKVLKPSGLFEVYHGFRWNHEMDRGATRTLIRKIETQGSEAYAIDGALREAMLDADVIFTHLCPIGKGIISQAPHLRYIVSARGGVENIAVEEAQKKGIRILHCPIHNAVAVAEMTIGLMICETRNIARADGALRKGMWREVYPNSGSIMELRSSVVGLLGFGAIARLVGERLKAFGCRILIHDPFVDDDRIRAEGYVPVSKEELVKESDILSLHGRIAPNDPPLIGKEELKQMKKSAYLINTARAVLVDMKAVEEALANHSIAGAAMDVFPQEPLPLNARILTLDNCTLSNHRGGDTLDSYNRAPEILLAQFKEVLNTGSTRYML